MQLLTTKELSKLIKVKPSTLYAWVSKGLIPAHKLNGLVRFDLAEIEQWVNSSKIVSEEIPVFSKKENPHSIDSIVQKVIEDVKGKKYNCTGKPDQNKRSQKGGLHGTL